MRKGGFIGAQEGKQYNHEIKQGTEQDYQLCKNYINSKAIHDRITRGSNDNIKTR